MRKANLLLFFDVPRADVGPNPQRTLKLTQLARKVEHGKVERVCSSCLTAKHDVFFKVLSCVFLGLAIGTIYNIDGNQHDGAVNERVIRIATSRFIISVY